MSNDTTDRQWPALCLSAVHIPDEDLTLGCLRNRGHEGDHDNYGITWPTAQEAK